VTARDDLIVGFAVLPPLLLFLVREQAVAGAAGFPLDDSWIHLHFARNLAEGAGFSFNPGVPVAGSTAPLWTLLLGAGSFAFGASLVTAKLLGIAAAVAAAIVTRRAALAWGASREVAVAAGIALSWMGGMAWGALSGMEVSLAALLVAAAMLTQAADRPVWTATLASLASMTRPEAVLLLPLLMLAKPLSLRRCLAFAVIPLAIAAPMIAFSLATTGTPYPSSAAAKVEGGVLGWVTGISEPPGTWRTRAHAFAGEWVGWLFRTHVLLPVAVLVGVVGAWLRRGRSLGLPALLLAIQPLAMAVLAPYRGPGFQEGRYVLHVLPIALVALAVTLGRPSRRLVVGGGLAALALSLVTLGPAAERYAWGVQNVNGMQVDIGRWVDRNVPRSARLAVNDIGAIAFFSRRQIIDLVGLVTPEVIPYRREGEAGVIRYLTTECPEYLIVFPSWFPRLTALGGLLQPVYRVTLDRPVVAGGPEMVVFRLLRCTV
jgi:hypothetical protein